MRPQSGLDNSHYSPRVRQKILLAAAEAHSYARAEVVLSELAEIPISSRHINRLADQAGQHLWEEQHERADRHADKSLPVEVPNVPELGAVEYDGGRINTREPGHGPGTHAAAWKESKTALFLRMSSETHALDPAPYPPSSLLDRKHVGRLAQEIAGAKALSQKDEENSDNHSNDEAVEASPDDSSPHYQPPTRLMRTALASLDDSDRFGELMAAEAQRKGFYQANRKAFVSDGMKCNWSIWQRHFADFTPIVDFIHVVTYLFKAALAIGQDEDFGWGLCAEWIRAVWQGRVGEVIAELADWLSNQPPPPDEVADDDPREIVRKTQGYLTNNQSRMDYPAYRKQGLPLTSTLMESFIKEMNYRVKGSEKFWNTPNAAHHILALKAAALSDDRRLYTIN